MDQNSNQIISGNPVSASIDAPNDTQPIPVEKTKVFFPDIDGLRFICFLSVFLYHSFATDYNAIKDSNLYYFFKHTLSGNGNLGVNFFFVLSGFLITYLLIIEKVKFRKINIGSFYVRRVLRIWPLFYLCVIYGFFIFPLIKSCFGQPGHETAHLWSYLTFTNNFDVILNGMPDSSTLNTLWSIAVEEQFYFFWPLLLAIIPQKRYPIAFVVIIIGSFTFRMANPKDNYFFVAYHTLCNISDMTVGGLGAWLILNSEKFKTTIERLPKYFWVFFYMAMAVIIFYKTPIFNVSNGFVFASERLVLSVFFIGVILDQCFAANSFIKMSRFKLMSKLGTYTYGMYCLHMIGILIVAKALSLASLNKQTWQVIFLEGGGSLILTIIIAYVSFHTLEKPFLKLKNAFAKITK